MEHLASVNIEDRMHYINDMHERSALTVSMQRTACVLLHIVAKNRLTKIQPLFIDTGFHFQETLELVQTYEDRFGVQIKRLHPSEDDLTTVYSIHNTAAPVLTLVGVEDCCDARKVQPVLRELTQGYSAKISGLMMAEGGNRSTVDLVTKDSRAQNGITEYKPLFDVSITEIEKYIDQHNLPIHALYAQNYTSIGCTPCTTPLKPGETDPRAGRWRQLEGAKQYCLMNATDKIKTEERKVESDGSGV